MPEQTVIDPINFTTGFAFIVGVGGDDYMRATANDANKLSAILKDQKIAGYGKDNVYCLTNQEASKINIEMKLENFVGLVKNRDDWENATVIIYLSGHGVQIDTGRLDANTETIFEYYFVPYYPSGTDLKVFAKDKNNLISFRRIQELLLPLHSVQKQFTVLDCCHSGGYNLELGANDGIESVTPSAVVVERLSQGTASVVITSCTGNQKSYVNKDAANTVFGECLFEALYGMGQSGVDDIVTFPSLYGYLTREVPRKTIKSQTNLPQAAIPRVTYRGNTVGDVQLCRYNPVLKAATHVEPVVPSFLGKTALWAMGIESEEITFADKTINKISSYLTVVLALSVIAFGSYFILKPSDNTDNKADAKPTPFSATAVNSTGLPKPTESPVVFENQNKSKPCGTTNEVGTLLQNQPHGAYKLILGRKDERINDSDFLPTIYLFKNPVKSTNLVEVSCASESGKFKFQNVPENVGDVKIWFAYPPQFIPASKVIVLLQNSSLAEENYNIGEITIRKKTSNDVSSVNAQVQKMGDFAEATGDWETANYCFRYLIKQEPNNTTLEPERRDYFAMHSGKASSKRRDNFYDDIINRLFFGTTTLGINDEDLLKDYSETIQCETMPIKIRKDALKAFASATANDEYIKTKDEIIKTLNDRLTNATEQEKTFLEDAHKQLKKKEEEK
jgi:Caspase domain